MAMNGEQAYAAMFIFLHTIWARTKSDELGNILGGLSLLPDGNPADPAVLEDWKSAVGRAVKGEGASHLNLDQIEV